MGYSSTSCNELVIENKTLQHKRMVTISLTVALLHLMEFSILLKLISNFPWWTTLHFFMLLYIYKNSLEKNPFLLLFIFSNVSASNSFNFLELYINFLFVLLYINFLFILSTNDLFIWSVQVLAIKCCFINEMTQSIPNSSALSFFDYLVDSIYLHFMDQELCNLTQLGIPTPIRKSIMTKYKVVLKLSC